MLKIIFDTEGQAFEDYGDREVSRILEEIAKKIKHGLDGDKIMDINGNEIGKWEFDDTLGNWTVED